MSNLKTKRVQIGDHSTATNNFVMHQSDTPDGKVHISNGTLDDHTSKMTLAHDGKLGVGTTSPTSGLDIQTDTNPVMKVSRGTNNSANINLYYNTTFTGQVSGAAGTFQLSSVGSSTPMQFYTNGSKNMEIDPSGRVTTPNQPSFLAGMSALQSLVHATVTKIQFNQSVEQTGSNFSTSNYRFTCPVAGRYLFNWHVYVYSVKNMESKLYKNGSSLIRIASPVAYQDENPHGGGGSVILEANANDYFEIYAAGYHSSGGGSSVYPGSGAERSSNFSGMLIG